MSPRRIPLVLFALISSLAPAITGCSSDEFAEPVVESPREHLERLARTHVVVMISASNRVQLNGSRVSPKELPSELAALGKRQPGRPVVLIMQEGTNPDAETFVRLHAANAGLGAVERTNLR